MAALAIRCWACLQVQVGEAADSAHPGPAQPQVARCCNCQKRFLQRSTAVLIGQGQRSPRVSLRGLSSLTAFEVGDSWDVLSLRQLPAYQSARLGQTGHGLDLFNLGQLFEKPNCAKNMLRAQQTSTFIRPYLCIYAHAAEGSCRSNGVLIGMA
eukprot:366254-Chlamydomonas_euryale.AAC.5